MKLPFLQVLCAGVLSCAAVGTAFADPWKDESGKGRDKDSGRGSYYYKRGYFIPPGHYPPPGEFRIWYPDRPPGHQPPPRRWIPRGAW
jgi:hypothetical protein